MKVGICLWVTLFGSLLLGINNASNEKTATSIRSVLNSHVHGLVLYIQLGIFRNCNPLTFESSLFQEADGRYKKFQKCYKNGINQIADKYDPTIKEFGMESVKNAENYPIFICELYYYTHECLRDFIPYMSLCMDTKSNITSHKMYEAVKHIIDYECENNAAVYHVMHNYRYDRCFTQMTRGIDEKLLEVIKIDEEQLLSTTESCRILDELRKKAKLNELELCNENIKKMVTNGFEKFWNSFKCDVHKI